MPSNPFGGEKRHFRRIRHFRQDHFRPLSENAPGYAEPGQKISLGYVAVPKDLDDIGVKPADWSPNEIETAIAKAKEIVEAIQRDETWLKSHENITSPSASYAEIFDYICQCESPKRAW